MNEERMNEAEALFAFIGWVTTLDREVTLSAHHHPGPIIDLIEQYCKAQGWEVKNPDWHKLIKKVDADYPKRIALKVDETTCPWCAEVCTIDKIQRHIAHCIVAMSAIIDDAHKLQDLTTRLETKLRQVSHEGSDEIAFYVFSALVSANSSVGSINGMVNVLEKALDIIGREPTNMIPQTEPFKYGNQPLADRCAYCFHAWNGEKVCQYTDGSYQCSCTSSIPI